MMITDPSPVLDQHILPSDLFPIFSQFFSPANSSIRIPELSLIDNLINHLYFDSEVSIFAGTTYLQSILTLPVLWFNPNSLNYNKETIENIPTPNLPPELYVTGKFAQSVNRILISQWTVVLFMLISIGIFVWSVGWLAWAMTIQGPRIGPFPLVDFASRIASAGIGENSGVNVIGRVAAAERSAIRKRLERERLFLGEISGGQYGIQRMRSQGGKIGFSTSGTEVQELLPGKMYV